MTDQGLRITCCNCALYSWRLLSNSALLMTTASAKAGNYLSAFRSLFSVRDRQEMLCRALCRQCKNECHSSVALVLLGFLSTSYFPMLGLSTRTSSNGEAIAQKANWYSYRCDALYKKMWKKRFHGIFGVDRLCRCNSICIFAGPAAACFAVRHLQNIWRVTKHRRTLSVLWMQSKVVGHVG
jgi:hypothetical protein